MSFTTAQLQTIKSAINANPTALADWNAGNPGAVAALLNAQSAIVIWRPDVAVSALLTGIVWSEYVQLDQAHRDLLALLLQGETVDATQANVRSGFSLAFAAVAGATTPGDLVALAQRNATNLEALFTTAQVCSTYGAVATEADVRAAMAS